MSETATRPPLKRRRTARDRLVRRARIMERVREGRSYEEIARGRGPVARAHSADRRRGVETAGSRRPARPRAPANDAARPSLAPRRAKRSPRAIGGRSSALIRVLDRLDKYQMVGGGPADLRRRGARAAVEQAQRDGGKDESRAGQRGRASVRRRGRRRGGVATGAGGRGAGAGREFGKIRFHPALGPKALILLVCAKE